MCIKVLWAVGTRAHSTSDEAFAVDTPSLFPALFPAAILENPSAVILVPEGGVEDETRRLLNLWKFFFATDAPRMRSDETLRRVVEKLYPGLVVVSGLRNEQLSRPATELLGGIVNTCAKFLDGQAGQTIWGTIQMLLKEGSLIDTVLPLWLRWINSANPALKPTLELLEQEEYWRLIQVWYSLSCGTRVHSPYRLPSPALRPAFLNVGNMLSTSSKILS